MPVAAHSSSSSPCCARRRASRPPRPARACAASRSRSTRRTAPRPRRAMVRARRAGYRRAETNPRAWMPFATLAQPRIGPELGGIPHGEIHHRRRPAAVGDDRARPATRTPPCPRWRPRSSPRRRSCCATSRGSATWRRCSTCCAASGASAEWREDNVVAVMRRRRRSHGEVDQRAVGAHPRLVPAGRAAAGPLRPRRHAAAGRRRDRPPPPRPAPGRVPRARRRRRGPTARYRLTAPAAACAPATSSWTSRR